VFLFVLVLCLVPNVVCVFGLTILHFLFNFLTFVFLFIKDKKFKSALCTLGSSKEVRKLNGVKKINKMFNVAK
jgi:hypothetical protein